MRNTRESFGNNGFMPLLPWYWFWTPGGRDDPPASGRLTPASPRFLIAAEKQMIYIYEKEYLDTTWNCLPFVVDPGILLVCIPDVFQFYRSCWEEQKKEVMNKKQDTWKICWSKKYMIFLGVAWRLLRGGPGLQVGWVLPAPAVRTQPGKRVYEQETEKLLKCIEWLQAVCCKVRTGQTDLWGWRAGGSRGLPAGAEMLYGNDGTVLIQDITGINIQNEIVSIFYLA